MNNLLKQQYDVVVVGAGPVGLSLALGLARNDVQVLVVEKNAATSEHSRAPAIWPRTQEILAGLGVIDDFLSAGIVVEKPGVWDCDSERLLLELPFNELREETDFPQLLLLPQSDTEKLLLRALQSCPGAEVRFSTALTGFTQSETEINLALAAGPSQLFCTAKFVAGCDGAHSSIRDQLGFKLDGETYDMRAALADVRVHDKALRFPRLTTRQNIAIGIQITPQLWRLILPFRSRENRPLEERVKEAAAELFTDYELPAVWQSEFSLHRRMSTGFSQNRVVLAGDAAHLNSPVGGQGMNSGIQDSEQLVRALCADLQQGGCQAISDYAARRRDEIEQGVNRFTNTLTQILLFGRGRLVKYVFRLVGVVIHFKGLRRRLLRRLAMLK